MKKVFILILLIGGIATSSFAQAPIQKYSYWDTLRYSSGIFTSPETVFLDINDNDLIVGYCLSASSTFEGFVYDLKNDKYHLYSHPAYTHTKITGINNAGEILGTAYTSITAAITFRGEFTAALGVQSIVQVNWNGSMTSQNQQPTRLNNNSVGVGAVRSGAGAVNRWINYETVFPPNTVSGLKRRQIGTTQYNTYGLGINDANQVSGWYLNGTQYRAVVFDHNTNAFQDYNARIVSAQSRTKFNDINNNNMAAVEYRDNLGQWQGTIAQLSGTTANYESDANFIFSQTKTPNGSSIQGINDSNDIVGFVNLPSGDKVGFFAITNEYGAEHLGLNGPFGIANSNDYFDYDLNHYDYVNKDIWLNSNDAFMANYVVPLNGAPLTPQETTFYNQGQVYPSWFAFVQAQEEDSLYITTNGTKKPKSSSIIHWLNVSTHEFQGNCHGLSAFALQHFRDPSVLTNRFGNNMGGLASITMYDSLSTGMNLPLMETMASLQLDYYDESISKYKDVQVAHGDVYLNGTGPQFANQTRNASSAIAQSIMNNDSARIMSWAIDFGNNQVGYHSVAPIGVTREFVYDYPIDSIAIIDPNYPNEYPLVVYDPITGYIIEHHSFGTDTLAFYYPNATIYETNVATPAEIVSRPTINGSPGMSYKTIGNKSIFYTKNACDYIINDNASANQFIKSGNVITNNFSGMRPDYIMDSDLPPVMLHIDGLLDTRTDISSCNGVAKWTLSYPSGEMLFSRGAALPSETDIIINKNEIIKVENPDATDKFVQLASNYGPANEESFVSIDSFKIEQNDTLRFETLDQYNFKLLNGKNAGNNYNLYVRYLAPTENFVWNTKKIAITPKTNHIIQLRPTSQGQKVVILIDSLQDGTIDDSIAVVNGGLSTPNILAKNHSIKVYPNPVQNHFSIEMNKLPQGDYEFMIYNQTGQLVRSKNVSSSATGELKQEFDMADLPKGMYLIRIQNNSTDFRYQHKIILR